MLTSTDVVTSALELKPIYNTTANYDTHCAVCGKPIAKGDKANTYVYPKTFNDHKYLAHEHGKYRCGQCEAVFNEKKFLVNYSTCIFSKEGAYPIMAKVNRAHMFLNLPKPPFVISVQASKSQHVVWKAPINLSKEVYFVQLGNQSIKINQKELLAAHKALTELRKEYLTVPSSVLKEHALESVKKAESKPEILKPFIYANMKGEGINAMQPAKWIRVLSNEGLLNKKDLKVLEKLSWGVAWALDCISTEPESKIKPSSKIG